MMNVLTNLSSPDAALLRKAGLYRLLVEICRDLELSQTQYDSSKVSYEAVAEWLGKSENPVLRELSLYAHGSTALGTTVRPIGREDFDVDLICLIRGLFPDMRPAEVKRIVGDRLREHAVYAAMLVEKKRCWRLMYAREFHLDISPTIINPSCANGGELVPDKSVRSWKPTNPSGYRELFERRCRLRPQLRLTNVLAADSLAKADIEAFPARRHRKGILRRTVQLLKRHRDIYFQNVEADIAPISIIITTLASQSYEYCVKAFPFDTEMDVLIATIRLMPHFIEKTPHGGRMTYVVPNETTQGENFAERWNTEPQRVTAFNTWHAKALADFENLAATEGLDRQYELLSDSLGEKVTRKVLDQRTETVSSARRDKRLFAAPAIGLSLTSTASAVEIPRNTNFGDRA